MNYNKKKITQHSSSKDSVYSVFFIIYIDFERPFEFYQKTEIFECKLENFENLKMN